MKELNFVPSGNKLEIVGLTDDGKAWVETLKLASRRIKRGGEGFAVRAFLEWKRSGRPTAFQKAMSKDIAAAVEAASAAAFINNLMQSDRPGISGDADAIVRANTAAQKRFGEPLDFRVVEGARDSECTVTATAGGITVKGHGLYYKMAKASAAREFLSRVK